MPEETLGERRTDGLAVRGLFDLILRLARTCGPAVIWSSVKSARSDA